jgi:predicted DCC family thiol-disulfide oxidoreductase YuxK
MPATFTLLFDGECPMCRREVEWLLRRNAAKCFAAVDIAAPGFDPAVWGVDGAAVHRWLHGVRGDGTVVTGMAAVREAWQAVGLGWVMAPTGWPVLRWFADLGYRAFARWRVPLGNLMGRKACTTGRCAVR